MFIYSKKIVQFINDIKCDIKYILAREACLRVVGERFHNRKQTGSYPINVVIYNNKSMLAYFDSDFYQLGFHECLMHSSRDLLRNVIRHELAHYLTFVDHGETYQPHGVDFKAVCQQMNWGAEVSRATFCLDGAGDASVAEESGVFRKVQKLMALANSSNKHEAEQAMIKSQQLLLMHNIESKYLGSDDDEKMVLKRIMKQKKEVFKDACYQPHLGNFFRKYGLQSGWRFYLPRNFGQCRQCGDR